MNVIAYDDNKHIRQSVEMLLNDVQDIQLVKTFDNCMNVLLDIEACNPDVIVMDIDMPQMNGIEAVKIVKKHHPNIQILMQTVFDDDEKVFKAIRAGASGYLLKNDLGANLINAINEVYLGGSPMTPSIARKVLKQLQSNTQTKDDFHLSKREEEVLEYLVKGLSYKMIASEMNITYDTVRAHIKKIYEKLHVSSMTEAVAKAISSKMFQ